VAVNVPSSVKVRGWISEHFKTMKNIIFRVALPCRFGGTQHLRIQGEAKNQKKQEAS
jgi:hypothetical protein